MKKCLNILTGLLLVLALCFSTASAQLMMVDDSESGNVINVYNLPSRSASIIGRVAAGALVDAVEATADRSFEELSDAELAQYAAIIAPAGYVADYLLYTEQPGDVSPACRFLERVMAKPEILKGFICHSLWLSGPIKDSFAGRQVTCHNNILSHVRNAGIGYVDQDVVVDGDLITARTGGHHAVFAKAILEKQRQ
jgi:protease I